MGQFFPTPSVEVQYDDKGWEMVGGWIALQEAVERRVITLSAPSPNFQHELGTLTPRSSVMLNRTANTGSS
ncbi:uncharacterized protein N7487_009172 [Penicillium crustosum]|uniref:uncharacterized protein n=1 Tax=Penicillium crustosum TaxID=36656 RepID=UPI0023A3A941|nr:uncharacterized protein N7487_009172 [Penicillium crustosum]KAJ5394869.1 hypothetical protein N7487_009172 [Penicillium crustosum]